MDKHFELRGKTLQKKSDLNIHKISLRARLAAQTAYKYLDMPETVKSVDLKVLASLLVDGLGMTEQQVLEMRVGDLFKFVKDELDDTTG